jgi:hypothetical protein
MQPLTALRGSGNFVFCFFFSLFQILFLFTVKKRGNTNKSCTLANKVYQKSVRIVGVKPDPSRIQTKYSHTHTLGTT